LIEMAHATEKETTMSARTEFETETNIPAAKPIMLAARIHEFGGPEALRLEEAPTPEPNAGEVRIRVRASAVNPADYKMRAGMMGNLPLPFTLGLDFSGEVEAVGPGVTKWKKGDAVFGTAPGSFAEYRVSPQDQLARRPDGLDPVKAAALPVGALTAWKALFDTAQLKAGQKVLIHGGAGGVGAFAVQLAKDKGAYVIATASARNQAFLKDLGADEAIDYGKARFEEVVKDADVVFDTRGGDTQARSYQVLKPGGILVSIVQPPSQEEARKRGVRAMLVVNSMNPDALERIGKMVAEGKLRAEIDSVIPLTEIRQGLERVQGGHVRGKIVVTVAEAGRKG
jgi:NADPH:quinone reductase-like Zn-dependent oxidoreductase